MAWATLNADDVLVEFTPSEASAVRNLVGGSGSGSGSGAPFNNLGFIVVRTIDEVRDYIRAGGYPVDAIDDTTIPKGFFEIAIAIARWRLLISLPQLKQLQTDEREKAYQDALALLKMVAQQQFAVEPPIDDTTIPIGGRWNSENKLIMRTHPVPTPVSQFPIAPDGYANPDAPPDRGPTPP